MSTVKIWQTVSSSSEDTFVLGEQLGRACRGGEVLVLSSDLGGGKTTFTQGLAKGLEAKGHITSPTFAISKSYPCRDGIHLYHFDFYRLNEPGVMAHELAEVTSEPKTVIAIEWGDSVQGSLPPRAVRIGISRMSESSSSRKINISCPAESMHLMKGIK